MSHKSFLLVMIVFMALAIAAYVPFVIAAGLYCYLVFPFGWGICLALAISLYFRIEE